MTTSTKRYWVTGYDYADNGKNRETFQGGVFASGKAAAMEKVKRWRHEQSRKQVQIISAELEVSNVTGI